MNRSPLSEACRGVVTVLRQLGLKAEVRDLDKARAFYARAKRDTHIDRVFKAAGIKDVVMTNDPFDDAERAVWEKGYVRDPRFHAALRLDPLLDLWPKSWRKMKGMGFKVKEKPDAQTLSEITRFLEQWRGTLSPLYLAASFSPDFALKSGSSDTVILEKAILPFCKKHGLPFALMLGVRRRLNPALGLAGDAVGRSQVTVLEQLCLRYPNNKFMATVLSRENQHQLAVAARKFSNLHIFGCWWFMNTPSLVRETTRMRMELLGFGFTPQHSDARVLDQLLYKWEHSRADISEVLTGQYAQAALNGWKVTDAEMRRDAARLLGGNFWEFLGRRI